MRHWRCLSSDPHFTNADFERGQSHISVSSSVTLSLLHHTAFLPLKYTIRKNKALTRQQNQDMEFSLILQREEKRHKEERWRWRREWAIRTGRDGNGGRELDPRNGPNRQKGEVEKDMEKGKRVKEKYTEGGRPFEEAKEICVYIWMDL